MKRISIFMLVAVVMLATVFITACSKQEENGAHVCQRKCSVCGLCTDEDCNEKACQKKCGGCGKATYTLKLMSVNLSQDLGGDTGARSRCANRIVNADPDVFGVQEENEEWRTYLTEVLGENGYAHLYEYRGGPDGFDEAGGIFYKVDRFNLVKNGAFWLSDTPDVKGSVATAWGEDMFPRVCTWVVLEDKASGLKFGYFNTHLSYYTDKPQIRTKSAELINQRMDEYAKGLPCFLSGDMNYASNVEPETYSVFTSFWTDTKSVLPEEQWTKSFNNYGSDTDGGKPIPTVPIDYIFVTKDFFTLKSFAVLPEELADNLVVNQPSSGWTSDHYPIEAVVEFTKADADKTK